jgi:hypothetical protein
VQWACAAGIAVGRALHDRPSRSHISRIATRRLVDRLFTDAIGALDLLCVYIGDRLGLYRALAVRPGLTPSELAAAAGVHERYAREWLEQQTVSGILEAENPDATDHERRYRLPSGHDEALG